MSDTTRQKPGRFLPAGRAWKTSPGRRPSQMLCHIGAVKCNAAPAALSLWPTSHSIFHLLPSTHTWGTWTTSSSNRSNLRTCTSKDFLCSSTHKDTCSGWFPLENRPGSGQSEVHRWDSISLLETGHETKCCLKKNPLREAEWHLSKKPS